MQIRAPIPLNRWSFWSLLVGGGVNLRLVVVDVSSLNKQGTTKIYREYISLVFATFDFVIVVMDADQGVNSTKQVDLLEFVGWRGVKLFSFSQPGLCLFCCGLFFC